MLSVLGELLDLGSYQMYLKLQYIIDIDINIYIDILYIIYFSPKDPITHLTVSNSLLVMGLSSNVLVRIDLENPSNESRK